MTDSEKVEAFMVGITSKTTNPIRNVFLPYDERVLSKAWSDMFIKILEPKVEPKVEPMPLINLEMLNREQWDYLQNNHVLQTLMHEYRTFEEYRTPYAAKATKLMESISKCIKDPLDTEKCLEKFFKQDLHNFVE